MSAWDNYYGERSRLALPWPRYPEPGALATDEIAAAYSREWHLAFEA